MGCRSRSTTLPARSEVKNGLRVSDNHRYLVDAKTAAPVFILADTAWNLGALTLEEVDRYLTNRASHGFNAIMFALNFSPQASEKNAYGEPAYLGNEKTELNPAYFTYCDSIVQQCEAHNLYVVLFALWAGEKAGTMNHYNSNQLFVLGRELGRRYRGVAHVIFCAGGEASPHYIDVERVNALGRGLKEGCEGRNLVTVHPVAEHSTSDFYAASPWLDFYLSQAKSGSGAKNADYDAAALVSRDFEVTPIKPTMMAEHRYESGTSEDPVLQRRSLYQCVFAGGFGHAYGHNALWQMTPHTGLPWMLRGWSPGVGNWTEALETVAVGQLARIKELLFTHPYLERIPDQSLVLEGQGTVVATRVQATRDGSLRKNDATYLMAYISSPQTVVLRTEVIAARTLRVYWFNPANGETEQWPESLPNPGRLTLEKRPHGVDWVVVVEDAVKNYPLPKAKRDGGRLDNGNVRFPPPDHNGPNV